MSHVVRNSWTMAPSAATFEILTILAETSNWKISKRCLIWHHEQACSMVPMLSHNHCFSSVNNIGKTFVSGNHFSSIVCLFPSSLAAYLAVRARIEQKVLGSTDNDSFALIESNNVFLSNTVTAARMQNTTFRKKHFRTNRGFVAFSDSLKFVEIHSSAFEDVSRVNVVNSWSLLSILSSDHAHNVYHFLWGDSRGIVMTLSRFWSLNFHQQLSFRIVSAILCAIIRWCLIQIFNQLFWHLENEFTDMIWIQILDELPVECFQEERCVAIFVTNERGNFLIDKTRILLLLNNSMNALRIYTLVTFSINFGCLRLPSIAFDCLQYLAYCFEITIFLQ
jgi:hypothetical protein